MDETVKDRLDAFIKYKNLNRNLFQKNVGVSNAYINNMGSAPRPEILSRIHNVYPELNLTWLTTGNGEMLIDANVEETDKVDVQQVFLVPTSAQAGTLDGFSPTVERANCEKIISPINGAELAITVSGDSMSPEYPNGSIVLLKRINEKAFIVWGKTYVLDTCNGIVMKNVYPGSADDRIKCVSINEYYPPFEVRFEDIYGWWVVLMVLAPK